MAKTNDNATEGKSDNKSKKKVTKVATKGDPEVTFIN